MSFNRRKFFKLSGAGVAGAVLTNVAHGKIVKPSSLLSPSKIIYRKLGNTGIELPIVSLPVERIDNAKFIDLAIEAGVKYFDTAYTYANGKSEPFLGNALKPYKRESLIISTKINTKDKENPEKELLEKFETSLKRLQTDYVDILFLHAVNNRDETLNERHIKVFQDLKKQGKARFIGVSTHTNMAEVITAATESKVWEVILTTYNFRTMENPQNVTNAIDKAAKAGIGIIAMKTMTGVYLDKEKTRKINTTAALKWALNNPNITTAIPGITSFEQLNDDLKLLSDITLTEQEKQDLAKDGNTAGLFCLGCDQCRRQCPNNVPIPDMMRAYMYAYGYNSTLQANQVLQELAPEQISCDKCAECIVECTQKFNIREKVLDISRLRAVPEEFLV